MSLNAISKFKNPFSETETNHLRKEVQVEEPTVYQKTVSQLYSGPLRGDIAEVTESELPGNEYKDLEKGVTEAENEGLAESLYESILTF